MAFLAFGPLVPLQISLTVSECWTGPQSAQVIRCSLLFSDTVQYIGEVLTGEEARVIFTSGGRKDVNVSAYGASAALKSLAQVSVKDGKTLLVNVFDPLVVSSVEKAIRSAGLNLNPVPDANNRLRVPIPKPTKETRESMRKVSDSTACIRPYGSQDTPWCITLTVLVQFLTTAAY